MSAPGGLPRQFHVVAFEGPDPYARAGGLASRVDGLTRALADLGCETHLWFFGDPARPGAEQRHGVWLHRWGQWLSREHPGGVYAAEDARVHDLATALPRALVDETLLPALRDGGDAVILAEEWQTVPTVLALHQRLCERGARARVALLWNANHVFGFDRIPWDRLADAASLTTVSRFMRLRMEERGVRPYVIANGLTDAAYEAPRRSLVHALRQRGEGRTLLAKVARWDPDKGWPVALRGVRLLRDAGARPLLVARGGSEDFERSVRQIAGAAGLAWSDRGGAGGDADRLPEMLRDVDDVDVVSIRFALDAGCLRALFRAAHAVLANSRFEPFGFVGLETMAAGGVACTGFTGEDYVLPGRNALALQSDDPAELAEVVLHLRAHPDEERALRRAAQATARHFAWREIVMRTLLPRLPVLRNPRARAAR